MSSRRGAPGSRDYEKKKSMSKRRGAPRRFGKISVVDNNKEEEEEEKEEKEEEEGKEEGSTEKKIKNLNIGKYFLIPLHFPQSRTTIFCVVIYL